MERTREMDTLEFDLYSIFCDVLRNCWMIIAVMLSVAMLIVGTSKFVYHPQYASSATLVVNTRGGDANAYSSLTTTTQMAGVIREVFQSNVLRTRIAEELGVSEAEVGECINAQVIDETNLLVLTVTSDTPQKAYRIIQSALNHYSSISDYMFSNAVLRVLAEPRVPYAPSNPLHLKKMILLGMLAGGFLTAVLLAALSLFRFTVKNEDMAERHLDGRIMGTIPFEQQYVNHLKRDKKHPSILISSKLISLHYTEAIRRMGTRMEHHMRRHNQKVVLVTSVLENEGKSSIAANLAFALAEKGKKVLLIDADLKKPAQFLIFDRLEMKAQNLSAYFEKKASLADICHEVEGYSLSVIFQKKAVEDAEVYLGSEAFQTLLAEARVQFDYVVVDSAPLAAVSDTEFLLDQMDTAVLTVRQDTADIRYLNDAGDAIRRSQSEFAGYVLNAFHESFWAKDQSYYSRYYSKQKGGLH